MTIKPFNIYKDNIDYFQFIKIPLFQIGILLIFKKILEFISKLGA